MYTNTFSSRADVVKLVYTADLKSAAAMRGGSSPPIRTNVTFYNIFLILIFPSKTR